MSEWEEIFVTNDDPNLLETKLAEWNKETDEVTFYWSTIEEVAEDKTNEMRGWAKILLAARNQESIP